MKKITSLLAVLLLLALLPVSVAAESNLTVESYLEYEIVGDTVTITDCVESYDGKLEIPATIEGKPVTAIGATAFFGCHSLSAVVIPEGVTSIGNQAFQGSTNLSDITIPASVTAIGFDAFLNTALYNATAKWERGTVYAEDGTVVYGHGLLYVGDCLVAANPALTRAVIKEGTRLIAADVFYNNGMKDVSIPASVTVVGDRAFTGCSALTAIHYGGTEEAWGKVAIADGNELLSSVEKTYESKLESIRPETPASPQPKKKVDLWRVIAIASGAVAVVTFVWGVIVYWPKKKKVDDTAEEDKPAEETKKDKKKKK